MEKTRKATSPKSSMTSSTGPKSPVRNGGSPPHKKSTSEFRGRKNEPQNLRKGGQDSITLDESKRRSPTSQTSPKRSSPKHEQPLSYFRLHTEERAIKRAGFNYQVASKINTNEIIRRFEEKLSKVIEEREIKMMRKEMVHKAQLMPASTRPLTVPKEPSFLRLKCCIGGEFHRHFCYNAKAIK
uniref:TPX2 C-terminal domain-containing protein n=1 Tax=Oryza barthii TaxID=65489 RepID=A0A0D3H4Z6_9ORYZ